MIKQVKETLGAGAFVNDDSRNGHRPLQLALTNGQSGVARLLIQHVADVNLPDRSGQTPLQAAANHAQFEIAMLLIKKGAAFNPHAANLGFVYKNLYAFQLFWKKGILVCSPKNDSKIRTSLKEKQPLPDPLILSCLNADYGIQAAVLTFLPIGADMDASLYKA